MKWIGVIFCILFTLFCALGAYVQVVNNGSNAGIWGVYTGVMCVSTYLAISVARSKY